MPYECLFREERKGGGLTPIKCIPTGDNATRPFSLDIRDRKV